MQELKSQRPLHQEPHIELSRVAIFVEDRSRESYRLRAAGPCRRCWPIA